jgi:NSS family neurotransmitter:Na+ symporter
MSFREEFSSRLGFILAASGSAVGLGNIWGFPTQVASNGGAAFVLVYLVLTFLLAYPVLMAELIIGRSTGANMIDALEQISGSRIGRYVGVWGFLTVSLLLAFYALIAGWMIAHLFQTVTNALDQQKLSNWLVSSSIFRDIVFCGIFLILSAAIVTSGVTRGIERWSLRLMPILLCIVLILISYVSFLEGSGEGWRVYLMPDFSRILEPTLLINAMGQAFFSMSVGAGAMLVYGSYVSKKENLPALGASVALVDAGAAVLAGMLIIPAMYVALNKGITIFSDDGSFIDGPKLVFSILPSLFESMGNAGLYFSFVFFALMVIAALTSSISMLESPVAYIVENKGVKRRQAVWGMTTIVFMASCVIALNMGRLFQLVIDITTKYSQPLLGFVLCVFVGWIWKRDNILKELKHGNKNAENSTFWRVWPLYVKFVCPAVIITVFYRSIT